MSINGICTETKGQPTLWVILFVLEGDWMSSIMPVIAALPDRGLRFHRDRWSAYLVARELRGGRRGVDNWC